MALTAQQWHILAICIFPFIDALGLSLAVLFSRHNYRTLFASGVMFSSGVLLSVRLSGLLMQDFTS